MKEQQIIDRLQSILYEGDVIRAENEIENLKNQFQEIKQYQDQRRNFDFDTLLAEKPNYDQGFDEVVHKIKIKKENILLKRKNLKEITVSEKKKIIRDLQAMVENPQTINRSFEHVKEIQQRWSATNRLNDDEGISLQNQFNYQLELFYHNVNINKELRDLDYTKNLEAKKIIIAKVDDVAKIEDIRQLDSAWKRVQAEWRSAGPVPWDLKDEINDKYFEANKEIKAKIDAYYEERRGELNEKLKLKIALVEKVNHIYGKEIVNNKTWKTNTEAILLIQKEWREIGFSTENETIWNVFRNACDAFFAKKREFYEALDSQREHNTQLKASLIGRAEEIQNDNNWKGTTEKFLRLQREWKELGPATMTEEPKLWKRFRNACDKFFMAKREYYTSQDEVQIQNQQQKEALIVKLKSLDLEASPEESFKSLKEIGMQWNEIGFVPFDKKDDLITRYRAEMDVKYKQLKLNDEERRKLEFESRVKNLIKGDENNAERIISSERRKIRERMDKVRGDINQYENNLGFFGDNIDEKNPLVKDVKDRIRKLRGQLQNLNVQLGSMNRVEIEPQEEVAAVEENAEAVAVENTAASEEATTETTVEASVETLAVEEAVVSEVTGEEE